MAVVERLSDWGGQIATVTTSIEPALRRKRLLRVVSEATPCLKLASKGLFFVLLLLSVVGDGCVSSPAPAEKTHSVRERLSAHTHFLAQPALRGRKPRTSGSRMARHYIEARFREYGLVPWGGHPGYDWSFGYGNNVVAFLPGSDATLSNELVLVSAHYDHLGKNQKGRVCPGAADNASGVGAMLELARQMAGSPNRPRRSVLFVAFDAEEMMLLGSFAFSAEKAVQSAKIVAVVNIDMLGRDLLDVVKHTLFVSGAERYPALSKTICLNGTDSGIRVLPLGTDLIGPRGDHIAFEGRGIPCLFFSCGSFRDYHQPEDTADKLDYEDISRSVGVLASTLRSLTGRPELETAGLPDSGFAEELRSVCKVMDEVNAARSEAGIKEQDAKAFEALASEAQRLLAGSHYDANQRRQLILDASGVLAPYFLPVDMLGKNPSADQVKQARVLLQFLQEFYLTHGEELLRGYRRFVSQLLKYHPGLIHGMPKFDYEFYTIDDENIQFRRRGTNEFALNALATSWNMRAGMRSTRWLFKTFSFYLGSSLESIDCSGSRQQVADYCLLLLRGEQANPERFVALRKVLNVVIGPSDKETYRELLAERLRSGHFKSEADWIVSCIRTGSPDLAIQALSATPVPQESNFEDAVCDVLSDPRQRGDVRAAAIKTAGKIKTRRALNAVCGLLEATSRPYDRQFVAMGRDDYPFSNRAVVKAALQIVQKEWSQWNSTTLGNVAHDELKKLARRDLGKPPGPWRRWVDKQVERK